MREMVKLSLHRPPPTPAPVKWMQTPVIPEHLHPLSSSVVVPLILVGEDWEDPFRNILHQCLRIILNSLFILINAIGTPPPTAASPDLAFGTEL